MAEPILIGTRGWEHPAWQGVFYPEELPPDWRFCYYSNWFRGVLVPAATWDGVQTADVRDGVEDSDPEFRFVLELPAALSHPAPGRAMHAPLTAFFKTMKPIRPPTPPGCWCAWQVSRMPRSSRRLAGPSRRGLSGRRGPAGAVAPARGVRFAGAPRGQSLLARGGVEPEPHPGGGGSG